MQQFHGVCLGGPLAGTNAANQYPEISVNIYPKVKVSDANYETSSVGDVKVSTYLLDAVNICGFVENIWVYQDLYKNGQFIEGFIKDYVCKCEELERAKRALEKFLPDDIIVEVLEGVREI